MGRVAAHTQLARSTVLAAVAVDSASHQVLCDGTRAWVDSIVARPQTERRVLSRFLKLTFDRRVSLWVGCRGRSLVAAP